MSIELLSLGLDFMSGLLGSSSQKSQQKAQMRQAQQQFDAQMDQSVQRRVTDAKKAGVHPLFAMGASVGASPTISAQGEQRSNPMQAALSTMAQTLNSLETNKAQAARDHAEALLLDSERKRIEQDLQHRGSDSGVRTFPLPEDSIYKSSGVHIGPAEYVSPQVAKSQRPGVEAGTHPARIEVTDPAGNTYTLPAPNIGMDEIGQVEYVAGIPGRMVSNFKKHFLSKREQAKLEEELRILRNRRLNPEAVRRYDEMTNNAWEATRKFYRKLRRYF